MASERIINEYDSTRIANAVDTLATNLADYSGTTVTPTDAMKAKLPSQTTADRIADALTDIADVAVNGTAYGTSNSAKSTVAKSVTTAKGNFNLVTGSKVLVKFAHGSDSSNLTLNVDSTGAKPVYMNGVALEEELEENGTYQFVYNGTQFDLVGGAGGGSSKQQGYIIPASESVTVDAGSTKTVPLTIIGDGAISVTSSDSTKVTGSVSNGVLTIAGVGGGIATITITMADSSTYLGTSATVSVTSVPNGSTVTPTNNIQTWLACASIFDKSYTTISQVLADSSTLGTLISSTNAVDYMVRSTSWATTVCANSTAMSFIGLNNYCANTLLADSTWLNAICNSTYIESVLNVKVPTMTSNTAPSGRCFASASAAQTDVWKAFDGNSSTGSDNTTWSNPDAAWYFGYEFSNEVKVHAVAISIRGGSWQVAQPLYIKGSNTTETDFVDIQSLGNMNTYQANTSYVIPVINNDAYSIYAVGAEHMPTNNYNGTTKYGINGFYELQFYGREDV